MCCCMETLAKGWLVLVTGNTRSWRSVLSSTFDFAPFDLDEAAEEYPVGFAEVTKRIKTAAGTLSRDFHTL
jgi:hypothetical protein